MSGTVYFISCTETNRVKIGFTTGEPIARLKSLQTGSAGQLRLMCSHPGSMDDERNLHERFAECRLHGEWFQPNDDLIKHMLGIVYVEGCRADRDGYQPASWVIVGLALLEEEFGELPPHLARFIGRGENLQ